MKSNAPFVVLTECVFLLSNEAQILFHRAINSLIKTNFPYVVVLTTDTYTETDI